MSLPLYQSSVVMPFHRFSVNAIIYSHSVLSQAHTESNLGRITLCESVHLQIRAHHFTHS